MMQLQLLIECATQIRSRSSSRCVTLQERSPPRKSLLIDWGICTTTTPLGCPRYNYKHHGLTSSTCFLALRTRPAPASTSVVRHAGNKEHCCSGNVPCSLIYNGFRMIVFLRTLVGGRHHLSPGNMFLDVSTARGGDI